jgi:hypothetical protein
MWPAATTLGDAAGTRTGAGDDVMVKLDVQPYLTLNLTEAPEKPLRGLFEITHLTVRLHEDSDDATIRLRHGATRHR